MSNGYQISEQDKLHYITMQVVYWIDIFTRQREIHRLHQDFINILLYLL